MSLHLSLKGAYTGPSHSLSPLQRPASPAPAARVSLSLLSSGHQHSSISIARTPVSISLLPLSSERQLLSRPRKPAVQGQGTRSHRIQPQWISPSEIQAQELTRHGFEARAMAAERNGTSALQEGGRVLITFDVDGTLVRSVGDDANRMHKGAFSYAFKELFGVDGTIDAIKHHGSTDKLVAVSTLEYYGVPKEVSKPRIEEITAKMLEFAVRHSEEGNAAEGLELLPGVHRLLTALSSMQPRVAFGLVTGNLEEIAWLKMGGLGVKDLFTQPRFGGFGSDHTDRGELVKIAAVRAAEKIPGEPFALHVHVGDTPNDILAAQCGGARPLGLTTGIFSRGELQAVVSREDAIILDSLEDLPAALEACGLATVTV